MQIRHLIKYSILLWQKPLSKLGLERTFITTIMAMNRENLEAFSLILEMNKDAHSYHYYSILVLQVLARAIKQEKKINGIKAVNQ